MYYLNRFHVPTKPDKWWFVIWKIRLTGGGKIHQLIKKITDPTNQFEKDDFIRLQPKDIHNEYSLIKEIFIGLEE